MSKKSGYMCQVDTGGKAIVYHIEQEDKFKEINKCFAHFLDDNFSPVYVNGKPKACLIDSSRLKIIGYTD